MIGPGRVRDLIGTAGNPAVSMLLASIEVDPRCDLCGETDDGLGEDWNGETGNHLSCEADERPVRPFSVGICE